MTPAPAQRPLRVLAILDEDGWCRGWSEPVLFVALVETRYYRVPVLQLPRDRRERRDLEAGSPERELMPVIYDVNPAHGFATLAELTDNADDSPEVVELVSEDVDWVTLIELIAVAQGTLTTRRQARAKERAAAKAKAAAGASAAR